MRPTIGRIVLLHDIGGVVRPCIVLRVGPVTELADLGVFGDQGYGLLRDVSYGLELGQWSWPPRA